MSEKKYFIDDRFEIPERIKKMTREERQKEIARLEAKVAEKKRQMEASKVIPKAV